LANQLINRSGLDAARQIEPKRENVVSDRREYLYRSDCPKGEVFEGEEAIAAAVEDGWVDSPAGLGETPAPELESEPEPEPLEESEPESEGDEDASE